jgi:hypothetical protein
MNGETSHCFAISWAIIPHSPKVRKSQEIMARFVSIGVRMQAEMEETAEAVPEVGLGDLGLGVAVVPVEQVVVEGAVVLPTTC